MTLLFMDGFDAGDYIAKWSSVTPVSSQVVSTTRFGAGQALSLLGNGNIKKNFAASSNLFVGFALRSNASIPSLLTIYGDAGVTAHLALARSGGDLVLKRGATTLATAVAATPLSVWNYIEVWATIADAGGRCVVKVDMVTVIDFTGDTKNAGTNTTMDAIKFDSNGAGAHDLDDLYVCNSLGTVNNTFLGDVRVQTLLPSGVGSSTQLVPTGSVNNWDNVNDSPYALATFNASATPGQRDTYAMADLLAGTGTVFGVQDNMTALKSDAGVASLKASLKSGATVYYDPTASLGTALATYATVRETDPATAAAWTVAGVNALEFGAEVV
jgi:hypothetical protein